ncbi:MAG: hypothetical protein ACD_14C00054G0002 [uncultured bacterium]|nr:MAG: hypothetical protein ACD_14C00054G0002 [uncultured bacterium]KKQ46064.1 MAG: Triosephosphate isomerase [Candidatus Moranbacteria bacterium GW2011_GWC2_37_8]KKQ62761.1 MAG: triosephosphate isomerase, triosephosphate isomerase (TIM) [Parcubacteria group bacterium GW2011_GWC1_38_22]
MKLIVGNLKMNLLSTAERDRYFESFKKELKDSKVGNVQIVLCVPSIHLESFTKKIKSKSVEIGSQNIFWEEKGSYTGEISAPMVASLGAQYSIIGHSERRRYFGETSAQANMKIKVALKNKLTPIYCVGETKEEKENGDAAQVIIQQISEAFAGISSTQASKIVIAYEPVWSVGSDIVPSSDEILEIKILLKKIFVELYGLPVAEKISVLYGGSVKSELINQVCIEPGMDGVLVGRESLVPRDFFKIVKIINKN